MIVSESNKSLAFARLLHFKYTQQRLNHRSNRCATDGVRPNNASIVACKLNNLQGEFKFGVRKKRKNTNKVRAYLFVVRSVQNKWCCRTSCFALDTACPICLLCPLRTISANAVRLHLSLLAVCRDLLISDCYRRSIACSRRGSHGNAVLRFFKIAINPRFDDIKKQVEQGSTCLFCGGDAGI